MPFPSAQYQDPAKYLERQEFFELGCGACKLHQPKKDKSEYHCVMACKQWPDGTNKTCGMFIKRKRK